MKPTVLIAATLDTKEIETEYLKRLIEEKGLRTIIVDAGILAKPRRVKPDVTREEVAIAGGSTIEELLASGNKGYCIDVMIAGVKVVVQELFAQGEFSGIIGIGGAQGTNIITSVMKVLPFGLPKLMVSTIACGTATFGPFVGTKDVTMMHSVVDVQGLNRLFTRILKNAAAAITGMVKSYTADANEGLNDNAVAMSMLGTTTPGALRAQGLLEEKGYEVVAFHQNGTGGIAMEDFIADGVFQAVLDINLHEVADRVVGGLHGAVEDYRLEAAGRAGIPQVIAPGSVGYTVQGPVESLSPAMKKRQYIVHNPNLTLVRLSPEELRETAEVIAAKVNRARGPVKFYLPLQGFSYANRAGLDLWDPVGNEVFIKTLKEKLSPAIELEEVDAHINDAEFIDRVIEGFLSLESN